MIPGFVPAVYRLDFHRFASLPPSRLTRIHAIESDATAPPIYAQDRQ
jgi:hypothetical protein